jgi:hypothetical protein
MSLPRSSSAAAPMAGYLIQIHRAIYHLSGASTGDYVGVETMDDVVKKEGDGTETWEQDKLTLADDGAPLTDRSRDLWRTLDIWTEAWIQRDLGEFRAIFLLVTNRAINGSALSLLKKYSRDEADEAEIVSLLMAQYATIPPTESNTLQALINRVLLRGDDVLFQVSSRIILQSEPGDLDLGLIERTKRKLPFAGLGIDEAVAYDTVVGWVQNTILQKLFDKQEAWISTEEFNRYAFHVAAAAKRKAILPMASSLLPVDDDDIEQVRDHQFVEHLCLVAPPSEVLNEQLAHYVRFIREKIRLTESGDVIKEHWVARGDRLKDHWKTIRLERCLNHANEQVARIGLRILIDAMKIREPLAEVEMRDVYMTMGHFHRLADDDRIAWHPDFVCKD